MEDARGAAARSPGTMRSGAPASNAASRLRSRNGGFPAGAPEEAIEGLGAPFEHSGTVGGFEAR